LEGVEMTLTQFGKVLEKFGVTPVSSIGEPFDPARHEAVGQLETAEHAPNVVAQELQKGYLLYERLLRPAMVMVAKPPVGDAQN
ncbi:MAG TPA: nucleotide exchange factor GrpE, partial [Geoalkalibacter subterraneus]|nr:nucleotide exchange factor GrpE [Geoalkalibacter subterraneus]